jgi:ABC-type uncharacterized transport system auxiliary subunit
MKMKTAKLTLFLPVVCLFLASCVKEVPPIQYYRIDMETHGLKAVNAPVYDSVKVMVRGMTGSIYYLDEKYGKNAFYLSRWAEPPDEMIKRKVILAINETGLAANVLPAGSMAAAQYALEIEIDDLSMHMQNGGGEGVVVLSAALVDIKHAQVVKSSLFRCSSPSGVVNPASTVDAINRAADECVVRLDSWLAK